MRFVRMIFLMSLALATVLASSSRAQDNGRDAVKRDQVTAATGRALDGLRTQVSLEPIGPGLTVQDLLNRTNSSKALMKTLTRAQQIGGPRWLDGQTCQVRLEIAGPRVAKALVEIATLDKVESPVPPEVLAGRLKDWQQRTFSATGTSSGAMSIETAMADPAHKKACASAHKDAVAQVLQSIRPIPLGKDRSVADALATPAVAEYVGKWLDARPVTQVEFRDDHQARVSLSVPSDELFDLFRASAVNNSAPTGPMDDASWSRTRDEFTKRVAAVSSGRGGAGAAVAASEPTPALQPIVLPENPPAWVDRQLDAEGTANGRSTRLKTARAAETDAAEQLRTKLAPLALSPGLTLGDAARQDARISIAVDRALIRARTTKVDYKDDGSAKVKVILDLRGVWNELTDQPRR